MTAMPPMDSLIWDATFPLLRLEGSGCAGFLHGQTSASVNGASEGKLIPACWLNATGRVQALLEIRLDDAGADVLVLHGDADLVIRGFDRVIFPADRVRLGPKREQRRLQRLQQGQLPATDAVLWLDDGAEPPTTWEAPTSSSAQLLEAWRMREGWPLSDAELNGDTNPFELGLAHWVKLDKGCYLGQETVAKLASRGGVKQQLRSWRSTTAFEEPQLESGDRLSLKAERAGVITSAARDPQSGQWFGLALVRRQALDVEKLDAGTEAIPLNLQRPGGFCDPPMGD
ncbi:MAG: aminomethyltransferase [Cyanobacteriota bacterium]|nr:aminomethyltransferase [Cyanobacteriota bacterium]